MQNTGLELEIGLVLPIKVLSGAGCHTGLSSRNIEKSSPGGQEMWLQDKLSATSFFGNVGPAVAEGSCPGLRKNLRRSAYGVAYEGGTPLRSGFVQPLFAGDNRQAALAGALRPSGSGRP